MKVADESFSCIERVNQLENQLMRHQQAKVSIRLELLANSAIDPSFRRSERILLKLKA